MQFSSSSVGEQRNRSSALRQNALSLACTDILETVEVGFVPDFFLFLSLIFNGEFRFSVRKPKVIAMSCHNKETISRNQGEVEVKTSKQPEAREEATEKVAVGFHFASDWSNVWREISKLITEQKQNRCNVEDYFPHFIQNCSYS